MSWTQEDDTGKNKLARIDGVYDVFLRQDKLNEETRKNNIIILKLMRARCETLVNLDVIFDSDKRTKKNLAEEIKILIKTKTKYDTDPNRQNIYVEELDSIWWRHYKWLALQSVLYIAVVAVGAYVSCSLAGSTMGLSLVGLIPVAILAYVFAFVIADSRTFVAKLDDVNGKLKTPFYDESMELRNGFFSQSDKQQGKQLIDEVNDFKPKD